MRVLVASDTIGALTSRPAGGESVRAWLGLSTRAAGGGLGQRLPDRVRRPAERRGRSGAGRTWCPRRCPRVAPSSSRVRPRGDASGHGRPADRHCATLSGEPATAARVDLGGLAVTTRSGSARRARREADGLLDTGTEPLGRLTRADIRPARPSRRMSRRGGTGRAAAADPARAARHQSPGRPAAGRIRPTAGDRAALERFTGLAAPSMASRSRACCGLGFAGSRSAAALVVGAGVVSPRITTALRARAGAD